MNLIGTNIFLRALEPEDLDYLYRTENDPAFALFGDQHPPYSRNLLKAYIDQAHQSIFQSQQLRLVIHHKLTNQPIGLIDLFDFDPNNKRVALGILISEPSFRQQGLGLEAARLMIDYAFDALDCHQVYSLIAPDNKASIGLFLSLSFEQGAQLKGWWSKHNDEFQDMLIYQKFRGK